MEGLRKDIQLWYSKLQLRGKAILAVAVLGFLWLLSQLILAITGNSLNLGWVGIVLNVIAITAVSLILIQFYVMRSMMKDAQAQYKELATRGRRFGNRSEQIGGVRNRGSMRRGGNQMAQAMTMITQVDVESLDKHYRPKPLARPTVVQDWKEITDPGLYALSSAPKQKIEIIDAADIGGGFFVGKYSDGIIKDRTIMTHRQTGEPLRFSNLRNAKKALSGNKSGSKKRRRRR